MSKTDSFVSRTISRRDFISRSAAICAGVWALKPFHAFGQQKTTAPTDYSSVIEKIKQTFPLAMTIKDITGASIALVDGNSIVWSEGFGYTDRSKKVKVTSDTLFLAGSISKSLTALGVLTAVNKGLLKLDDPVRKHLSWFSPSSRFGREESERITIRHLLSHHSGLGTWSPLGNPYDPQYHARSFEEVVKSTRTSSLKFPAGERFEYSNQGIDIAGYALAIASGKPFSDFMRDEILTPLAMNASTYDQAEATRKDNYAVGYLGKRPEPIVNGIVHPLMAAGGLLVSANDLARFIIFHLRGAPNGKQIIAQRLLQEMYSPQCTAKAELSGYGLGIYRAIQNDTVRLSHGGLGYGISAHYRFLPEYQVGIALLTNQDSAHNAPDLASRGIDWMLTAKLGKLPSKSPVNSPPKSILSIDESALRRLEGTYLLYEGILFRFKYEKGNLFHMVGNEKLKLDAHSTHEFTSGSRRYKFIVAENGKPKGVQISDASYDPQTAENSVLYLPLNDAPADGRGPSKPEWSNRTGKYTGTFIGGPSEVKVSLEHGYLYLNGEVKLTESGPDLFLTADGEAVRFKDEGLSVGNKIYPGRKL